MGIKELGDKVKEVFSYDEEKELGEVEETSVPSEKKTISHYEKKKKDMSGINANIIIFVPRNFDETVEIARKIKEGNGAMVNLSKLSPAVQQRAIDFLQGVTFGLNGSTKKVDVSSIICTPLSIDVEGEVLIDNEDTEF